MSMRHLNRHLALCALLLSPSACAARESRRQPPPEAPALATAATITCTEPQAPRARARQALARARGRLDRYPYASSEGPGALQLLSEARACLERAGDGAGAAAAMARHVDLQRRLAADYRDLRIQLSRALTADRDAVALRAARRLQALLQGREHPYVSYLRALEQRLARRAAPEEER